MTTNRLDWNIYQKGSHFFAKYLPTNMLFVGKSKFELMSHINGYEKTLKK